MPVSNSAQLSGFYSRIINSLNWECSGWERACLACRKLRFHPLHQEESKLRRLRQEDCC